MAAAAGVAAILSEHWDALEGDFQRYHGLNLVTCCFGPDEVGVRRLKVLIESLPPDSRTFREIGSWDLHDELGATQAEMLARIAQAVEITASTSLKKGARYPKPPLQWPRPSDRAEKRDEALTRHQIRQTLLGR